MIKIGIESAEQYRKFFAELQAYYRDCYNLEIDEKCKNESRLCFLPHDPNIYVNEASEVFYLTEPEEQPEPQEHNREYSTPSVDQLELLEWCIKCTDKKQQFVNGNRNGYVAPLAYMCNDYGVAQDVAEHEFVSRFEEHGFPKIRNPVHNP